MLIEKIGQRVQHPYCPEHRGTVSNIEPGGRFQITWDDESRKRGKPRTRFWYPASFRERFTYVHNIEVRILEEDGTTIEIPEELIKAYGIGK